MAIEFAPKNTNRFTSWLKNPRNLVIAGLVIIVIIALGFFFSSRNNSGAQNNPTVQIHKSYTITAWTSDHKATDGQLKLNVTDAQIGSSILVQGQVARPVKGKSFLIIDMEIENPYKVSLYAFPVDLFRFVRSDGAMFAPSVHQGTVEIRAQATKKSNVAFVVSPGDKKFTIEVGEIGKNKQTLEIHFK